MSRSSFLVDWWNRAELWLVGPLAPEIRHNMYVDVRAACTHSVMATVINFIPLILRRAGASTDQIAYYYAVTSLGLLTAGVGIWLMRHGGMKRVALLCWLLGRGSFILTAFAFNSVALLAIFTFFWMLEPWPSPAYIQTMEVIYPANQRGRIMAFVRVALVGLTLIITPIAGWVLDQWGYRALLPLAGLSGLASSSLFFPLMRKTNDTITKSSAGASPSASESAWNIWRTDSRMPLYLTGTLLFGLGALIPAALFPVIQVDRLNLSYTEAGLLGFVQSLFWFLGYLFGGRLLDRFGGIRCLQIVFIIQAIVILPYIWATQGWMLLPSFIATGLVTAGADLASLYAIIELAGPKRVPAYTTISSTVAGLRGLFGPFMGSLLVGIGWPYWAVFILSAALTLGGTATLAFIKKNAAPALTLEETRP